MNEFQESQFIFVILRGRGTIAIISKGQIGFGPDNEKETGVSSVNDLEAAVFQKAALEFAPTEAFANDFRFQGRAFVHTNPFVVTTVPRLALLVAVIE